MKKNKTTRRAFLRGVLGGAAVTVALPMLDLFLDDNGEALADGSALPRRFGIYYWGNGMIPDRWTPEGTGMGDAWKLSPELALLEPVKDDITVITGMSVKAQNIEPHWSGIAAILSGVPLLHRSQQDYTFAAPSIDQLIADEVGKNTRFPSLELGAQPRLGLSHRGPDQINPAEDSPQRLFERIFGVGFRAPGDNSEPDPSIGWRRSVLDVVKEDNERFKKKLGARDRIRLEQHFEGVRALELRLARLQEDPPQLAACSVPEMPTSDFPDIDGRPQLKAKNRAMCDVLALALACDQTRVFSNFITWPLNNLLLAQTSGGHHQLTHDEPGDQPQVDTIVTELMGELSYMIQALRNIPEGEGTLLDNCAVFATSDVSLGKTHSLDEFPIILAGGAGGKLKTGMHYRSAARENANKVLLTLLRAMGLQLAEFGVDETYTQDGLTAVEA
jgi:hypothetical protein